MLCIYYFKVSLLLKHNGNETGNSSFGSMIVPPGLVAPTPLSLQSRVENKMDDRIKCSDKKVNESHASITPTVASNVMSCSDKICLWNALGLQGALLSEFFLPLTLQTITVGRKASAVHARRALCCRLQVAFSLNMKRYLKKERLMIYTIDSIVFAERVSCLPLCF